MTLQEKIAKGTEIVKSLPGVKSWSLIGSAMYLDTAKDVDFAVLLDWDQDPETYAMNLHEKGWGRCGDYDDVAGWFSVRNAEFNLMITGTEDWFKRYVQAMHVCAALRLERKFDRVMVCRIVRDGFDAETARAHTAVKYDENE